MAIKYAEDIKDKAENVINNTSLDGCITGEEFDEWLYEGESYEEKA